VTIANTSATGGPLSPLTDVISLPLDDVALDAVFQTLVVDLTGLSGDLVRPRWQSNVPKQPEPNVNWCAIGVTDVQQDDGPWLVYDPVTNTEQYWDHELVNVLASFYGPNSQGFARLLRAGLNVPQNTEELLPYAIRYISCGPIRQAPELVNQQWIRREDLSLQFRRKVTMIYGVENILVADIHLQDDTVVNDIIIVPQGATLIGPALSPLFADSSGVLLVTETGVVLSS
jgi:hypothetical protein